MNKKKVLTVEDLRSVNSNPDHAFRVVKIVNSILFVVGTTLGDTTVNDRCKMVDWTVNIIPKK